MPAPVTAEREPLIARLSAATQTQPAAIAPAPMPVEDLQQVLGSAGLTLAATDPEKLRAAQEAAGRQALAPRLGREPKQPPAPPAEPLVQIETR